MESHGYCCERWWLHLPPCARCGLSHVLKNCRERLTWEMPHDD